MKLSNLLRSFNPRIMSPIKYQLNTAKEVLKCFPKEKHWMGGGPRSAAVAATMILNGKIVALQTDTIYGLACLAQNNNAIHSLYDIKKRDTSKPLAICLSHIEDIETWAEVKDIPDKLIASLLPGPTTIVLKRKEALNPLLNEGMTNVGIRIPKMDFILNVMELVNRPVALTSANVSQERSTLHPKEFEHLWSKLDGIFYDREEQIITKKINRFGSTVVDLSVQGEFKILRQGEDFRRTIRILKSFDLKERIEVSDEKCEATKSDHAAENCKS